MEKYSYEYCKNLALKYNVKSHLKEENQYIYRYIIKNGWADEMFGHMKKKVKYTYEFCKNYVKNFDSIKSLRETNNAIYVTILKNKWNELLDNLTRESGDYLRILYSYEFKEYNSVYIGLTFDIKKRDIDHHRKGSVFKFVKDHNISHFEPKILEENVEYYNAGAREEYYINIYKNNGWNVLNKAKAGSLGSPVHELNRKICCFDNNGELECICTKKEACEKFNIKHKNLVIALRNFNRSCNGHRFIYEDVWNRTGNKCLDEKIIQNEIKKICILDNNYCLLNTCESKTEARTFLNVSSVNNCVGRLSIGEVRNVARGDKFICYEEDYKKYKNGEYEIYKPSIPKNKVIYFVPINVADKEKYCKEKKNNLKNWEINRKHKKHISK